MNTAASSRAAAGSSRAGAGSARTGADSALPDRIAAEHAAVESRLPASIVRTERRGAALTLIAGGLPTTRDENWRYANLRSLEKARFAPLLSIDGAAETRAAAALPAPLEGFDRYVFVDGALSARLSAVLGEAGGVLVRSGAKSETAPDQLTGDARFAALNLAFAVDAIEIIAAAGATRGVEIIFFADTHATSAASYPRVRVEVAPDARLVFVERHLSDGEASPFVNAVVSTAIAAGGSLDHYRLQNLGTAATHLETIDATLDRDTRYALHAISLGGQAARSTLHVRLAGERARFDYGQVVSTDGIQVNDTYALVEHLAPQTETREAFRGIAAGRSRIAFNGRIVIERTATQASSAQTLRSLLAGPQAEANVRPQLEIHTDEVKASHGATAGKLDEQMLFYLLSRGVDRGTAQSLLKWAFLSEVVARIEIAGLRSQLEHEIAQRFRGDDAQVAKELI